MKTLQKPLSDFSFASRERRNGKIMPNKCGRDFLYYALNFYYPEKFNANNLSPLQLEKNRALGMLVPARLAWTQLQFLRVADFLRAQNLQLSINDRKVRGYMSFIRAILFSRKEVSEAVEEVKQSVVNNEAVGIDVSLGIMGLLDHVVFVYGFDEENFYVFDTHKVKRLEYEALDETRHFFKLPIQVVRKRWTRFGRVWRVKEIAE